MQKRAAVILFLVCFLILPFASASWFSDFFGALSGKKQAIIGDAVASGSGGSSGTSEVKSELKSCCFCAYDDLSMDQVQFRVDCAKFFKGEANPEDKNFRCDVKEEVPLSKWATRFPELMSKYQCAEPLKIYHAEHGPVCDNIVQLIQVCVSNSPTCDLEINSDSCQSFRYLEDVEKQFRSLQKSLGPDIVISACGNRLNGYFGDLACTLTNTVKVSQKEFSMTPGPCKSEGTTCSPVNGVAYSCTNSKGQETSQRCCPAAASLKEYTAPVISDSSYNGKLSAEGASSCPIPPCGTNTEVIVCSRSGQTYECITPNGEISNRTCCAKDSTGLNNNFGNIGEVCSLPLCIEKVSAWTSCDIMKKSECMDKQGKETKQICCGIQREGARYKDHFGFLNPVGEDTCICSQLNNECLTNNGVAEMQILPPFCTYSLSPENTVCGELKDSICGAKGYCEARPLGCDTSKDCYKKGKGYCSSSSDSVVTQKCNKGFCEVKKSLCNNAQKCIETEKSASCVRQKISKSIASTRLSRFLGLS